MIFEDNFYFLRMLIENFNSYEVAMKGLDKVKTSKKKFIVLMWSFWVLKIKKPENC